jgi:hypothetical protein
VAAAAAVVITSGTKTTSASVPEETLRLRPLREAPEEGPW